LNEQIEVVPASVSIPTETNVTVVRRKGRERGEASQRIQWPDFGFRQPINVGPKDRWGVNRVETPDDGDVPAPRNLKSNRVVDIPRAIVLIQAFPQPPNFSCQCCPIEVVLAVEASA
jgi:hypothetical protein